MLNVASVGIWVCLTFAVFKFESVTSTSGVLLSFASIIFGEFYFGESVEPRETRVIKFSRKLSILQYIYKTGLKIDPLIFIRENKTACNSTETNALQVRLHSPVRNLIL